MTQTNPAQIPTRTTFQRTTLLPLLRLLYLRRPLRRPLNVLKDVAVAVDALEALLEVVVGVVVVKGVFQLRRILEFLVLQVLLI